MAEDLADARPDRAGGDADGAQGEPAGEPAGELVGGAPERGLMWRLACRLHHLDYARALPWMARLPLPLGYALAALRGHANAALARDWRSMGLRTRHIWRMSLQGAAEMAAWRGGSRAQQQAWVRERYRAEAQDEFEAWLINHGRFDEVSVRFEPPDAPQRLGAALRERGLVLLTPHFDSFYLGIALLAHHGALAARREGLEGLEGAGAQGVPVVNVMASAVPHDPRVDAAVSRHFRLKYERMSQALNGGSVPYMEDGVRPFYRMLQERQALVVLADAPVLPQGAEMALPLLGARRRLAAGAWRLAERTGAAIGGFICEHEGGGRYRLRWCEPGPADEGTLRRVYGFLEGALAARPGRWWAMDMLPNLPVVETPEQQQAKAQAVDVVVVNYRCSALTIKAVQRLMPWSAGRVFVVDNSEDEEEARALREGLSEGLSEGLGAARGQGPDASVQLLVAARNLGFGAACQWAWSQSEAPLVLLLNPDAVMRPADVLGMAELMRQQPQLAALNPRIWWNEARSFLLATPAAQSPGARLRRGLGSWLQGAGWAEAAARRDATLLGAQTPFEVETLSGGALMLRRSAVASAGGLFDAAYFMYFEDTDLCRRLRGAGWTVAVAPAFEAVHEWRHQPHKAPLMAQAEAQYLRRHHAFVARVLSGEGWASGGVGAGLAALLRALLRALWRGRVLDAAGASNSPVGTGGLMLHGAEEARAALGAVRAFSPSPTGDPALVRPGLQAQPFSDEEWALLEPAPYWAWTEKGWRRWTKC